MSLDAATKKQIIDEYATGDGDTGSPEVQVALLTRRISDLTGTSRSTSTTTTAVVACCCSSVSAVVCSTTCRTPTSQRYRSLIERLGLRR